MKSSITFTGTVLGGLALAFAHGYAFAVPSRPTALATSPTAGTEPRISRCAVAQPESIGPAEGDHDPTAGIDPDVVFNGVPASEILPEGQVAPGAEADVEGLIGRAEEPFSSPARQRCLQSCDNFYYRVLIPNCNRVRSRPARSLCYRNANAEYSNCMRRCPRT